MAQVLERTYTDTGYYYPYAFVMRVINTIIGVIEMMLALRLVLEFFAASTASAFVAWVYEVTDSIIGPFAGAFPNLFIGGFPLELSTIFAMIGYAMIGWLIMQLLSFVFTLP